MSRKSIATRRVDDEECYLVHVSTNGVMTNKDGIM